MEGSMSAIGIVLAIIGGGLAVLSFFLPARKKDTDEEVQLISEAEVRRMVEAELKDVREKISDIVDETINYSIEKTERAMERVANEKIMAVNEYSDTVIEEINKNHKEVVFLYDMLNDKHDTLMATVSEATQSAEEIKQTVKDAEVTAKEAAKKVQSAEEAAEQALVRIQNAEATVREAQESVQEAVESVMGAVEDTRTDLWSLHSAREYQREVPEDAQALPEDGNRSQIPLTEEKQSVEEPVPWGTGAAEPSQWGMEAESGERFQRGLETEPENWRQWEPEPVAQDQFRRRAGINPEERLQRGLGTGMEEQPRWGAEPEGESRWKPEPDEAEFMPIKPRRVEIIHEPDGDYIAPEEDISTSKAFADMGIFGSREEQPEEPRRKARTRRGLRKEAAADDSRNVDIRFAKGKDNGRNSNERILELHKAGKSNMAIAKELGLGLGEVKLVIDLFEGV